jgi:hypothetical protein
MKPQQTFDKLLDRLVIEFGLTVAPDVADATPARRVNVRNQTKPGRPVLCSVGKLKPGAQRVARSFCARKAG